MVKTRRKQMKRMLRLVTWNVNGLRAILQRLGQNLPQFLESFDAEIICLQETKLTRSELDEEFVRPSGASRMCQKKVLVMLKH